MNIFSIAINRILLKVFKKQLQLLNQENKAVLFEQLADAYQNKIYADFRKQYLISNSFRFNGKDILLYGDGSIICGDNSYIGNYSTIQSVENCSVTIGNNCSISHNVRIYTSSNLANQDFNTTSIKEKYSANVTIGNGVWIGANVFINPGITIEDNSVVGANSVVTKNIERNAIYGGVPARLLKYKKD